LRVSDEGYQKQEDLTLLPLYPLAVRSAASGVAWAADLSGVSVSKETLHLLAALYINVIAFVVAGKNGFFFKNFKVTQTFIYE
jgi:hypothetical protein